MVKHINEKNAQIWKDLITLRKYQKRKNFLAENFNYDTWLAEEKRKEAAKQDLFEEEDDTDDLGNFKKPSVPEYDSEDETLGTVLLKNKNKKSP